MDTVSLPLLHTGFPSPAESFWERRLNVQDLLVPHPDWTFFSRVEGDSMGEAGIHAGNILVIDRSLDVPQHAVVVVALNGSLLVKRIEYHPEYILLLSDHPGYPPIPVSPTDTFVIWGVCTWSLNRLERHGTDISLAQTQPGRPFPLQPTKR